MRFVTCVKLLVHSQETVIRKEFATNVAWYVLLFMVPSMVDLECTPLVKGFTADTTGEEFLSTMDPQMRF